MISFENNLEIITDEFGNVAYYNEKFQEHREDGPAVIMADGKQYYFLNGQHVSKEQHARMTSRVEELRMCA